MDSINILSAGHARYYLELGQEDYFFTGGEKLGKWWGGCAESVGLRGNVQKEQLRAAFRGGIKKGNKFVSLVQQQKKKIARPTVQELAILLMFLRM